MGSVGTVVGTGMEVAAGSAALLTGLGEEWWRLGRWILGLGRYLRRTARAAFSASTAMLMMLSWAHGVVEVRLCD